MCNNYTVGKLHGYTMKYYLFVVMVKYVFIAALVNLKVYVNYCAFNTL